MKNKIKFFRRSQLPSSGEIGSVYFIHGETPTLWLYTQNGWENYSSSGLKLGMINITYSELKNMVLNESLIPGMQYRIIDYVTMTKASDLYLSAQHPFDVIVTADSVNKLNENARVVQRDGDVYFANSNLAAWKIKYTIDNDSFYGWVDDSCKGVIYEMTDEFNNTCPYDFKNILQARYLVSGTNTNADGKYLGWIGYDYNQDSYIYRYTFSKNAGGVSEDVSLNNSINVEGSVISCKGNKMSQLIMSGYCYFNDIVFVCDDNYSQTVSKRLENIVLGSLNYNMTFGPQCYNISTGDDCHDTIFSDFNREIRLLDYCRTMIFGRDCYGFQLGNDCSNITTGDTCFAFTIGNECYNIKIGTNCRRFNISNYCRDWELGDNCQIITTGNNCSNWKTGSNCSFWSCGNQCYNWSVGNDCSSWSCGNSCNNWSTGNSCIEWSAGNECTNWSTGSNCHAWSVGNNCYNWSVGNYCSVWKAGNRCYNWVFGGQNAPKDYFNSITIESYNHNFCLNTLYTTSSSKICRGIHIAEMAFASLSEWTNYSLTEANGNVNQLFCTTIGKAGDKKLTVTS